MSVFRLFGCRSARLLVGAMGALVAGLSFAEASRSEFATAVPLTLSGEGPWYRLELPMALHFAAQYADLRDLRVFNAEGQAQAYALTLGGAQQRETRRTTEVKRFPLYGPADAAPDLSGIRIERSTTGTVIEVRPEGAQAATGEVLRGWLLDTGTLDAPLEQLVLDWSAEQEGFQRFSIEASDDLQHWQSWGDGQIARLAFADQRIEQREIELPGQSARYLRLLWQSPQQAPMLDAASLVSATSTRLPAPLAWSAPLKARRLNSGEYSWTLPLALSVERVQIELPQTNTLAPVILSGRREGEKHWQPLARGLLYRLPENGQAVQRDGLNLPGQPVQELKLQVDERGGGLGSETPLLKVGLPATQVIFLARGTPPYTLAIGNGAAKAANLPLGTLIPGYTEQRLAGLGQALPGNAALLEAEGASAVQPGPDWKRAVLWAVLLAGVGLLAAMAFSLLRAPSSRP